MKRLLPFLALAAVILLVLAYFMMLSIPAGAVGVADAGGPGKAHEILKPGLHFHPMGAKVFIYSTEAASASGEALVTPATGGEIPVRFNVTGRLDPDRVGDLHAAIGGRPPEEFLSAQTGLMLREYAARADAVEVLTPEFRSRAADAVATALKKGGFAEASIAIKPPDEDTLLAAAQYLAPRHEASRIRQTTTEALAEPGGSASWKLLTAMGLINESERKFFDAERNYLDALAIDPTALPPMTELVALFSAAKEWLKLKRVLDAALTADPKSLQHINWMSLVLLKLEDYVGAERVLKQGLAIEPDNTRLLANLGTLYMKTNRSGEALVTFKRAVDAAPDSQQALFNMGSALAATGRFSESLPLLERAEQSGSPSLPLLETLTIVHDKLGNKEKAASYRKRSRAMEAARKPAATSPAAPSKGGGPAPTSPTDDLS